MPPLLLFKLAVEFSAMAGESIGELIDPNRPRDASVIGYRALGSKETEERTDRRPLLIPSSPDRSVATGSSEIGEGGVGVRGGAGIGRLEAMLIIYELRIRRIMKTVRGELLAS